MVMSCLTKKVSGSEAGLSSPSSQTEQPPAHRKGLTRPGSNAERRKPVAKQLTAGRGARKKANARL